MVEFWRGLSLLRRVGPLHDSLLSITGPRALDIGYGSSGSDPALERIRKQPFRAALQVLRIQGLPIQGTYRLKTGSGQILSAYIQAGCFPVWKIMT